MAIYEVEVIRIYREEHITMLVRAHSEKEASQKALKEVKANQIIWFGPNVVTPDFEAVTYGKFKGEPDSDVLE